jgi:hypothetical protein
MNVKLLFVYSALVLLAGFLLLYNLDDRLLWGDEAETALLAHNITRFGVPKATDGKNYITLLGRGYDSNKSDIWVWSPWLDEYVTAASFYIFGKSTFAARFPFALIALLSIISLLFVTQRLYHNHELTIITVLLCVTNAAFLIHARQCRYYALIAFAQIWLLYGYKLLITAAPKRGGLFLVLALAVQFYCNYIVVLGNVLALCISTVFVCRRHRNLLRNLAICLAGFVLLTIPWLAYAKPWHQSSNASLGYFTENLLYYLSEIHFYIMPLVLVFIIPVWYLLNRRKQPSKAKEPTMKDIEIFLWILVLAHLTVLGMIQGIFFRYIILLVPVIIILTSVILANYVRPPIFRYLLILILCCSNAIAVFTAYPLRTSHSISMPFVQFIREITSNYEDRLEDMVCYLRQNANPNQSLYVLDPEFPLIFYTDMRIIDGRFTQTLNPNDLPDWILSESASGMVPSPLMQLPTPLLKFYEPVNLNVHDTPRSASQPEPDVHVPFTASKMTQLVIYKKIR